LLPESLGRIKPDEVRQVIERRPTRQPDGRHSPRQLNSAQQIDGLVDVLQQPPAIATRPGMPRRSAPATPYWRT
jgi:hypothetical protein